ncbi:MAG TPA: hypothetical protein VFA26_19960 [Gemmataceae bacterium]|nr:hypothetical protein [Gemmataceae bacterium]
MAADKPRGRFRWRLLAASCALSAAGSTFVRLSEIVADWARNFFTPIVL